MASQFRMQVVDLNGEVVKSWPPGRDVECEIIENLKQRVAAKGVGVFRTTDHVVDDVYVAIRELLYDLKVQVPPPMAPR